MNSSTEPSTLFSRVTRLIALPSLLILLPNYLALAAVTCDAGFETDSFSVADYNKLAPVASSPSPKVDQIIDGNSTESYLIGSNSLTLSGSLTPNSTNIYQSTAVAGSQVFQLAQDFADRNSSRTASYSFKNKFTDQAQPLNKLSLSIYDIDSAIVGFDSQGTRYFSWFDQVTINGFTSTGALVSPIVESKGAGITSTAPYRQNTVASSVICNGLDDNCKLSVTFTDPVVRVDVVYGNNPALNYSTNYIANNDPVSQVVHIKFDSYCYQPQPRLTYTKALSTSRKVNTDEFVVQIKDNADGSVVTNGITSTTTTGSSNTVTTGTGTTGTFKINPTKTYTLTEAISGTTNLADYTASYTCKKSDGTTVTALDPKNLKMTYGDNWTCTITNGRPNYTFSGTVFNDNGKIVAPDKDDVSTKYLNDSLYFNGKYDPPDEFGIPFSTGHTITLSKCLSDTGNSTFSPQTTNINADGTYSFSLTPTQIGNSTRLCATQNEPDNYIYSVDSTSNVHQIDVVDNKYTYPDNNFGDLIQANAALVLVKSQYVHDCSLKDLMTIGINYTGEATAAYSKKTIDDIEPAQCIAYRIEAINRGNVPLTDIIIRDTLQKKGDSGALVTSTLTTPTPIGENGGVPTFSNESVSIDNNGKVITNSFSLGIINSTRRQAIRFNTKYGATMNAQ